MAQIISTVSGQGFAPSFSTIRRPQTLDEAIKQARDYARMITETSSITSPEAAAAWDIVEELLAAKAHRKAQNSFADYCAEYPEAPEARMYDV